MEPLSRVSMTSVRYFRVTLATSAKCSAAQLERESLPGGKRLPCVFWMKAARDLPCSCYSSFVWFSISCGRISSLPKNVSRRLGASMRQNAPKTKEAERLTLDCNHPPIEGPILKPTLHVTE